MMQDMLYSLKIISHLGVMRYKTQRLGNICYQQLSTAVNILKVHVFSN